MNLFIDLFDVSDVLFMRKALIYNHLGRRFFSKDDLCLAAKMKIETIEAATDEFCLQIHFHGKG